MMHDWQVRLQLEAMAILVRVEGMKAMNAEREALGLAQAYSEEAFVEAASEIEGIARAMGTG